MANLATNLAGIRSPNPFWLASAPPTNSGYQVLRAFAAGWGGVVWKTLVPRFVDWNDLNLDYKIVAQIDPATCINCNRCWIACEDAAHQCIDRLIDQRGALLLKVDEEHCVGCNLCRMVCPVDECISMVRVDGGQSSHTWRERLSIPS
jgi:Pyruvate/2-oxoacid:ferredoxin oxidoreductase delta subunit